MYAMLGFGEWAPPMTGRSATTHFYQKYVYRAERQRTGFEECENVQQGAVQYRGASNDHRVEAPSDVPI